MKNIIYLIIKYIIISIYINYEDFINNKDLIYNYIRNGFRFSLVIDNTFDKDKSLGILDIFAYILVLDDMKISSQIIRKKNCYLVEVGDL